MREAGGELVCWRSIMREAGGEKLNREVYNTSLDPGV
jgi:hypothetical protein